MRCAPATCISSRDVRALARCFSPSEHSSPMSRSVWSILVRVSSRNAGLFVVAVAALAAAAAPIVAPHATDARFARLLSAPPTRAHVQDDEGAWHAPFIHRWRLVNQLEQRYEEDRSLRVPLAWFADRKSTRLNSSHEWISYAVF